MRYLLTGGGTGGHVYPALAIADEVRRHDPTVEFLYVGARDRLEARIVPGRGYPIRFVRSCPMPRSRSLAAFLRFAVLLFLGVCKGAYILLRFRPQLIIGTGGYVSAPVLFAYSVLSKIGLCRAKVFIYEPNAYPGQLNKVVGRFAHRVGLAFEQAGRCFDMKRVAVVGCPVRREFWETDREASRRRLGIEADRFVVLAFGGSGGARAINEAVVEALPALQARPDVLVLHITGRYAGPDYDAVAATTAGLERLGITGETAPGYRRFDYMENIQEAYAAADVVICRAGASTLTEVCVCGLPALVVPLPTAAEDHQAINARELERRGAARVLYQEAYWCRGRVGMRIDGERLARAVLALAADPERRREMAAAARAVPRKDSLELVYKEIEGLLEGHRRVPLTLEFPLRDQIPADPNALLRHVRGRLEEGGGCDGMDDAELAYLRYQADRLLSSEGWYEVPLGRRNVGIKLVGYLQYRRHLPLLLQILGDRQQVSWLRRACGGDFVHVGILRRNVIEYGLRLLGDADEEVRQALLQALKGDPYFEVRAVAAQALGELCEPDETLEDALLAALEDGETPVALRAVEALGAVGVRPQLLERLRRFYLHADWKLRHGLVDALCNLLERGVLHPDDLSDDLERILAASPYFRPTFPLQDNLRRLAALLDDLKHSSLRQRT